MNRIALGSLLIMSLLSAFPARAEKEPMLEAKIEMRVLDFVAEPFDRKDVAVLYDRANPRSQHDASIILQALMGSASLARHKFSAKLIELGDLKTIKGLKAVVVPAFSDDIYDDILRYAIANRTLVLSIGLDCVKRGRCMVGVATDPEIEIGVSSANVRKSGIRFDDGFQLMVKEY